MSVLTIDICINIRDDIIYVLDQTESSIFDIPSFWKLESKNLAKLEIFLI